MQTGRLQKIGIAKETIHGTAVAPEYWLSVDSWDLNPVVTTKNKEGAFARIEDSYGNEIVKKHNEPSIGGVITDKAIGELFLATLGTVSSVAQVAPNDAVYDHTFSLKNDNDHPSLTISMEDENISKQVAYCMLNKLDLDCVLEDYAKFKAEFIGKFEADGTLTPAYTEENIFVPRHIEVKIADSVADLDSASAIDLQSIKLTIDKNVEANFGFGSDEPKSISNKDFVISGSIERLNDSAIWRDLFSANTGKAMRITLENTDITIGSDQHPKIVITLSEIKFNPYKLNAATGDLVKETIDFKGFYSTTESSSISAVLTNLATSY